jgi:hypothetical protein
MCVAARPRLATALAVLALGGCAGTVLRPVPARPVESPLAYTGQARVWSCGGHYLAEHVEDAGVRPLRSRLRVGERRQLWCRPEEEHHGPLPSIRWFSSRPEVVSVTWERGFLSRDLTTAPVLHGRSAGESEVHGIVDVYGGVRVDLSFFCCGDSCDAALPRCERIPIPRVVVTR